MNHAGATNRPTRKQKALKLILQKLANTLQPQGDADVQTVSHQIPVELRRRGKEWHGKFWFSVVRWDRLSVNELSLCIYVCRKLQSYINTWHIETSHKRKQERGIKGESRDDENRTENRREITSVWEAILNPNFFVTTNSWQHSFQSPETYESDLTLLLFSVSLTQAPFPPPGDLIWSLCAADMRFYFWLLLYVPVSWVTRFKHKSELSINLGVVESKLHPILKQNINRSDSTLCKRLSAVWLVWRSFV